MRKIMTQQLSDFDTTRKKLMRDFQERFERIVQLESSLEESREKYADLLSSVNDPNKLSNLESSLEETRNNYNNVLKNSNSKQHQGKLAFLERNLDHLASVQKQLVEKNSTLKKDLDVCERKLVARSDRISYLENQLQETQHAMEEQSTKFEAELGIIRSKLEEARTETAPASSWLYSSKIAKPLRGGVSTSRLANNEEDENDSVEAIKEGPKKQLKSKPSSWYMNLLNQ